MGATGPGRHGVHPNEKDWPSSPPFPFASVYLESADRLTGTPLAAIAAHGATGERYRRLTPNPRAFAVTGRLPRGTRSCMDAESPVCRSRHHIIVVISSKELSRLLRPQLPAFSNFELVCLPLWLRFLGANIASPTSPFSQDLARFLRTFSRFLSDVENLAFFRRAHYMPARG